MNFEKDRICLNLLQIYMHSTLVESRKLNIFYEIFMCNLFSLKYEDITLHVLLSISFIYETDWPEPKCKYTYCIKRCGMSSFLF